jgi:hypothetical protein
MRLSMVILMFLAAFPAFAGEDSTIPMDHVPAEVRPFVVKGFRPLSVESADLNGDGLPDFVLVLEKQKAKPSDPDIDQKQRPLLILVGQPGGALKEMKRNESIVYCSTCGGAMGDPFVGIEAAPKTFTVSHYGGSAQRWSLEYTFNFSHRDNTWQLVRVKEENFNALEPNEVKTKIYTPPKHFGKIDIEDFDPENWKNRGAK